MNLLLIDWDKISMVFTYQKEQPLLFNSGLFLVLFLGFYSIYVILQKTHQIRHIWVILFSLFFYYKSNEWYFILLLVSTVVDFTIGILIDKSEQPWKRKLFLLLSVLFNLGMLSYFKYFNLLIDTWNSISGAHWPEQSIFLPVGISFFTFQTMSYAIDVYRRDMPAERNLLDFAFFVTFFPQLFAGPIVRAYDFLPQTKKNPSPTQAQIGKGFFLIMTGLIKKAVIADYISTNFVDRVFDQPLLYSGLENLAAVYGYAFQIYYDFSGYSDMAIGLAWLMGYQFIANFDVPYQSASITEFWRRWHMSLSSWLRDYLYIALGGNRKGKIRTYINLMLTMLLGGLWHGASWKFMAWGGLHGVALAFDKLRLGNKKPSSSKGIRRILGVIFTFHFVAFCWIFFRADTFDQGIEVINQIVNHTEWHLASDFFYGYQTVCWMVLGGMILHFSPKKVDEWAENSFTSAPILIQGFSLAFICWIVSQVASADIQPFIYFQF